MSQSKGSTTVTTEVEVEPAAAETAAASAASSLAAAPRKPCTMSLDNYTPSSAPGVHRRHERKAARDRPPHTPCAGDDATSGGSHHHHTRTTTTTSNPNNHNCSGEDVHTVFDAPGSASSLAGAAEGNQWYQSFLVPCILFYRKVRRMSVKHILFAAFLVVLLTVGNLLQILMLNFWLDSFPSDGTPGNYTAFAIPGILFCFIFLLVLAVYVVAKRPNLAFTTHAYGWGILTGIGFADALNSWLATYAASYTSEVLQALFTNLCPLYSVFFCKWILHDPRRYLNWWIVSVFALTIAGILAVSLYSLIRESAHMADGKWWILIFFSSIPFRVLINVWQSLYMIVYTKDEAFSQWLQQQHYDTLEEGGDDRSHIDPSVAGPPDEIMGVSDAPRRTEKKTTECAADAFTAKCRRVEDGDPLEDTLPAAAGSRCHSSPLESTLQLHLDDGISSADSSEIQKSGRVSVDQGIVEETLHDEGKAATTTRATASPSLQHSPVVRPTAHGTLSLSFFSCESCHVNETATHHLHTRRANELESEDDDVAMAAALTVEEEDGLQEEAAEDIIRHAVDLVITARYHQGDDTAVKLVMLAGETFLQLCFTLALLPADALPWFGNSNSVTETWTNFLNGIRCVFTIKKNFLYGFLYTLGFVFSYIGGAYLNQYSVALCSIVTQLSSPFTALILVIAPQLNVVEGGEAPWYCNLIAIVVLIVAAFVYVVWEEKTNDEKMVGEYELKRKKMQARPVRCDNIRIEED